MASLAQLPKVVGFFSYSRNDDEGDNGAVSALANRIFLELRAQLGRNNENFKLWRDKDALAAGEHWKEKLNEAVSESVFFIQMVTPSVVNSQFCRFEFESFIERERELGRNDLVFPILYISVPELDAATTDDVISIVKERQFEDWRPLRYLDVNSTEVRQAVGLFCSTISRKLRLPWLSPEERRAIEERKVKQLRLQEAETKRQDEERRQALEAQRKAEERARKEVEEKRQREQEEREEQKRRAKELEAERKAEEKRQSETTAAGIGYRSLFRAWWRGDRLRTLAIPFLFSPIFFYAVFYATISPNKTSFNSTDISIFYTVFGVASALNVLFGLALTFIRERMPLWLCCLGIGGYFVLSALGLFLDLSTNQTDKAVGGFFFWSSMPCLVIYVITFFVVKGRKASTVTA
jgi:hypothetical protein